MQKTDQRMEFRDQQQLTPSKGDTLVPDLAIFIQHWQCRSSWRHCHHYKGKGPIHFVIFKWIFHRWPEI